MLLDRFAGLILLLMCCPFIVWPLLLLYCANELLSKKSEGSDFIYGEVALAIFESSNGPTSRLSSMGESCGARDGSGSLYGGNVVR